VTLAELRDVALDIALTQDGVRESGGANRGPEVERYLAAVGLGPGHPWCCAFVIWCYAEAIRRRDRGREMPLRRTGKVARLWEKAWPVWKTDEPALGAVAIHLVDPRDSESNGHTGLVIRYNSVTVETIEGNTNAVGSRLGDCVRINARPRSYYLGYIDIGRESPVESEAVA
jgi:CHAP domain-containing protein